MRPAEPRGPIAILAGAGQLPNIVSEALRRQGRDHRILVFRGFADRTLRPRADAVVDLLDVAGTLACLERWRPAGVVLAGTVRRPKPSAFLNAFSIVRNRRFLKDLMARGDDSLLRSAVGLIEEKGHKVVGVQEIAPELLAPVGVLGAIGPTAEEEQRAIEIGFGLLSSLSAYDVGQAAVVAGARVLAIEGPEGTDRMLARVRSLRRPWGSLPASAGGVLIKTAKVGQDLRVDLPAAGPRTVSEAHRAGLQGIAVGAGVTLIIDRAATIAAADRRGLFLVGVPAAGPQAAP
jgi:UDP-2,3-diacylglucosamine hydrolase